MPPFLEAWIGAIVWVIANMVYADLRRRGERGIGRILAFFAGQPLTWISLFAVREGKPRGIRSPPDDEDRLLREIRVDRELRERWSAPEREPSVREDRELPPGS